MSIRLNAGPLLLATAVLAGLKIGGCIAWPWAVVLIPLWVYLFLAALTLAIVVLVGKKIAGGVRRIRFEGALR